MGVTKLQIVKSTQETEEGGEPSSLWIFLRSSDLINPTSEERKSEHYH